MDIGLKIKDFRNSHDLTRKAFSDLTGISTSYIEQLETNKKTPTIDTLLKITAVFNITVSELLGETDSYPIELKKLLNNAQNLNLEQLEKLTEFIKTLV